MAYVWRVLIAIGIGVVAAAVVYSITPPTQIAEVESATILSDGRTIEVRGPFDSGIFNKPRPDHAEVHVYPSNLAEEEFDELTVWVTLGRSIPKHKTLVGCVEAVSTRLDPVPLVAGFAVGGAGPTTVSDEACREIYTTVLPIAIDPDTPIRLLPPGLDPPVPVVQVRSEKASAVGILTAIVVLPFLLLARRTSRPEEAALLPFD